MRLRATPAASRKADSYHWLGRIERAVRDPGVRTVAKLADGLGVPELFRENEPCELTPHDGGGRMDLAGFIYTNREMMLASTRLIVPMTIPFATSTGPIERCSRGVSLDIVCPLLWV